MKLTILFHSRLLNMTFIQIFPFNMEILTWVITWHQPKQCTIFASKSLKKNPSAFASINLAPPQKIWVASNDHRFHKGWLPEIYQADYRYCLACHQGTKFKVLVPTDAPPGGAIRCQENDTNPNNALLQGEIPQIYHIFALFDPPPKWVIWWTLVGLNIFWGYMFSLPIPG